MQKWEYGFLTKEFCVSQNRKTHKLEGFVDIKFNGEDTSRVDIVLDEYSRDGLEEIANSAMPGVFNKLGRLGWELCNYTFSWYLPHGTDKSPTSFDVAYAKKEEKIIFRRPIE